MGGQNQNHTLGDPEALTPRPIDTITMKVNAVAEKAATLQEMANHIDSALLSNDDKCTAHGGNGPDMPVTVKLEQIISIMNSTQATLQNVIEGI